MTPTDRGRAMTRIEELLSYGEELPILNPCEVRRIILMLKDAREALEAASSWIEIKCADSDKVDAALSAIDNWNEGKK